MRSKIAKVAKIAKIARIAKVVKKSPSKMNRKDKLAFRKKLLEIKGQILKKMNQTYKESKEVESDVAQDLADKAESSYTKEFLLSLTDSEREQLLQIDEALKTLEKGDFGMCQNCGQPISKKRLDALPWAAYCIDCQQKVESEKA
jgi:DnaK suppressor protein